MGGSAFGVERGWPSTMLRALFRFVAISVLGCQCKVPFDAEVLFAPACPRHARVKRGDEIRVRLAASADVDALMSQGVAEQTFVAGKHGVPALNRGVAGMCEGERRRITVPWGEAGWAQGGVVTLLARGTRPPFPGQFH